MIKPESQSFGNLQNLSDNSMGIHYGKLVRMFAIFPATPLGE